MKRSELREMIKEEMELMNEANPKYNMGAVTLFLPMSLSDKKVDINNAVRLFSNKLQKLGVKASVTIKK